MRYLNVCFLGLAVLTLASCSSSEDTTKLGNWVRRADYQGDARREAVSFVIGDTAYVGTGISNVDGGTVLNSFYKYDAVKDNWTMIASLTDVNDATRNLGRSGASAFAAAGKGYVATGIDFDGRTLNDTWAYTPATNSWQSRADFPGAKRYWGVGFAIGDMGYIGTGYDGNNNMSDFYKYNPNSDSWSPATALKDKRRQATAFVIGDSAYVVAGTSTASSTDRMYVYSASNDIWNEKARITNVTDETFDDDYTTIARYGAVAFVIKNKAYLATGSNATTWEYDPINDRWTEKTAFDGASRTSAVGFSVLGRGFLGLGYSASTNLEDLYEFLPDAENDTND
jgi:N-acetylneuraminic acid mutarotase